MEMPQRLYTNTDNYTECGLNPSFDGNASTAMVATTLGRTMCLNPSFDGNASTANLHCVAEFYTVLILLLMEMPQRPMILNRIVQLLLSLNPSFDGNASTANENLDYNDS